MTHGELERALAAECGRLGYWCWVARSCQSCALRHTPGWVDVVVLGKGRAWFVELKATDGRRSRQQVAVAVLLASAGLQYRLIRPYDLPGFAAELAA